ncbi:MAG: ABC transporter ATP-binding protein [Gammaproteobacteria bacterium]|jgi:spermidine/putrescine ABC transporter ATP-binding subunit|nr:ABC transporter ATP-binding protein [Gammaproteobacteria bacterium]|tara:strand:- start:1477 stop:2565 length:1089 start_codon:yes stop_codon:yes gene_type:complete
MSAVELKKISKRYGNFNAVNSVDLVVNSAEFLTLLGPSGCGKTTTLRLIAGFAKPTIGSVVIGGVDVTNIPPHLREVGLVFQDYALFPHMSVGENVEFGLKMRKTPKAERAERVGKALELVQLGGHEEKFPNQLSGGQQQRVALARALVIRPKILLLDEPFGALDKQLRDHMRVELRVLQQQLGISTIFVTHDQEEAMAMSDRICVMESGVIRQIGQPNDIYERPRNRFVADFMGRSNLLDGRIRQSMNGEILVDANGLLLHSQHKDLHGSDDVVIMIRPERISLKRTSGSVKTDNASEVAGKVNSAVYLGSLMHYEISTSSGTTLLITSQIDSDFAHHHFAPGQEVSVVIPRDAVYVIGGE